MKKIIALLMLLVSLATVNAKCNWSTLKLQQWNERNYYKWQVSGAGIGDDTCVSYQMSIYNFQTGKSQVLKGGKDTGVGFEYYLYERNGFVEVLFNKKGKYKMYLKVWNRCLKCDTALYRMVELITFPKCNFSYNLKSTDGECKDSMVGEMGVGPWIKGDTCWSWYSYIWNGPMLDKLSDYDFDSMSNDQLYRYYDFNDSDVVWQKGPNNDARIIKFKFPHNGHYLIATQWYNKCLDQDTFFFTRITVKCNTAKSKLPKLPTLGIKVSPNPADDKVIFTVASTDKIASNTYEIYDSKGKLVMTGTMGGSICVGVSNLPNGTYIVKIGKLTQKFVIQH